MKSLSRRIDELMEVVRLDSGVARPRRETVEVGEIVEAALSRFGDALERHTLAVDPPPKLRPSSYPTRFTYTTKEV